MTGGTISTTGAFIVQADGTHRASATAPAGQGGIITISAMLPTATISGHTSARLDGTVSSSTKTTVSASAEHSADASAFVGSFSIFGVSGAFADAEVTKDAYVDAIVGGSIGSSGEVKVEATLHGDQNKAVATARSITIPGIVAGSVMVSKALIGGRVKAELAGTVTSSGDVWVHADGTNDAESKTLVVVVAAFAGGGAGSDAEVTTDATTQALIDSSASSITSGGQVHVQANSHNTADAESQAGAGGFVSIGITIPTATVAGGTKATFDGHIVSAGSLLVEATGNNTATSTSDVVTIGGIAAGGAKADAEITSAARSAQPNESTLIELGSIFDASSSTTASRTSTSTKLRASVNGNRSAAMKSGGS